MEVTDTTAHDTAMLAYARETRDAAMRTAAETKKTASRTNFIAWVVGVFAGLSLLGMLIGGIEFAHFVNVVTSPASTSNCASQGGFDPSC
jgi:hypothetical protein